VALRIFISVLVLSLFAYRAGASSSLQIEENQTKPAISSTFVSVQNLNGLPPEMHGIIVSNLDGLSLIALSKVSRYWKKFLLDDMYWENVAKELMFTGIRPSKEVYPCLRLFVLRCFSYTFQDLGEQNFSVNLFVSADGSTIVMPKWENKPGERNPPVTTVLTLSKGRNYRGIQGCYANGVNADGSVIVGWSDKTGHECQAFRWTKDTDIVPLFESDRSVAFSVSPDGLVVSGETRVDGSSLVFRCGKDTMDFSAEFLSSSKTESSDGFVRVYTGDDGFFFSRPSPYRWDEKHDVIESIAKILKRQNVLPEGWDLKSVQAVSTNGIFVVGTGKYHGADRMWMATIPRFHDDNRPLVPMQEPKTCLSWLYDRFWLPLSMFFPG